MAPTILCEGIKIKKGFLTPFSITVYDKNNKVVDLTEYTSAKFYMVDKKGVVKVDGATATIVTPKTSGKITYTPVAGDVDTVGSYRAYFALYKSLDKVLSAPTENFELEVVSDLIS